MKGWVPLVLLAGCASDNPSLVVERQPTALADATAAGWTRGSAILAGDAQAFTFPQPVSLRFTIVDDISADTPMQLSIAMPTVAPYGSGSLEVSVAPRCEAMSCTAELTVTGPGSSMVAIGATGPKGAERACFYYALVDATTDTDALHTELEAKQQDCRFAKE